MEIKSYKLRTLLIKSILLIIISSILLYNGVDWSLIISCCLTLMMLDLTHPLILRNYFFIYTFLIFTVARPFFIPDDNTFTIHGILYSIGFYVGILFKKYLYSGKIIYKSSFSKENVGRRLSAVWSVLIGIILLKTANTIYTIFKTGISSYFGGSSMVSTIENYGQADVSGGVDIILSSFFSSSIIAMVAMYVCLNLRYNKKINYYVLAYALLFLPLLALSRNAFAFGIITMLLVYTMAENTKGRFSGKLLFYGAATLVFLIVIGVAIGKLREGQIQVASNAEAPSSLMMIYGELSPIVAYETIANNLDNGVLKHQYGKTIIPPIIFKVIPRSWYPDKPINSTAYYAQATNADAFQAGFMIPSTYYGDLYLNFGLVITILICIFFGYIISVLDWSYISNNTNVIFIYIIIHNNFYAFLRNNIPEGFMNILLTFVIYIIYRLLVETISRQGKFTQIISR